MASRGRKANGEAKDLKQQDPKAAAAPPSPPPRKGGGRKRGSNGAGPSDAAAGKQEATAPPAPLPGTAGKTLAPRGGASLGVAQVDLEIPSGMPVHGAEAVPVTEAAVLPQVVAEIERLPGPHGVVELFKAPPGSLPPTAPMMPSDAPANSIEVRTPQTLSSPAAHAAAPMPAQAPSPADEPPSASGDEDDEADESPEGRGAAARAEAESRAGSVMDDAPGFSTLATMPALASPPPAPAVRAPAPEPTPQPVQATPVAPAPPPEPEELPRPVLQPPLLFEIAWEVCWQLGGIYTVLRTKAAATLKGWGDRYTLIGPYNPSTAAMEFEAEEPTGPIAEVIGRLRDMGIPAHYGFWLVNGHPHVILLDYRAMFRQLDADKYLMWADHGISIPNNDGEMNEVVAFGFACTEFFRQLSLVVRDRAILAHFHEWMGGVAVPRIAHLRLPIATVFTTHATLLGRYIAGDNPEFYNQLPFIDADAEARRYQIYARHLIEKAAAHASTVFTTVSEVTAYEAEKLLGRRPEGILPNGLNIQRFAALHEFQNLHRTYKEKIHEFVMGHFFPSYSFDLEKTIYLFTSGRYEYRNKGMDMFIEAMHRLNQRLRYVPDRPTVVAFIITKAPVRHINVGVLQNQMMFDELKSTCRQLQEEMGQHLFLNAARGKIAEAKDLLSGDSQVRLKRAMHAWRSGQPPVIVTHDLVDDQNDPTLKHMRHRGLFNSGDDPVKMVFHPQFVTQTGPLINLDYEQFVRGCHMGIFPSYYEPWGYTPMEAIAMGLPAVTTDLSGFGAYVRRHITDSQEKGICVLDRRYRGFDEACNQLVDYLFDFVRLSRRQRIELRNKVEKMSELFDWSALIRHYKDAHDLALDRIGAKRMGTIEIRMV